jgi:hypothetical protein
MGMGAGMAQYQQPQSNAPYQNYGYQAYQK